MMAFDYITQLTWSSSHYLIAHHPRGIWIWECGISKPIYTNKARFIGISKNEEFLLYRHFLLPRHEAYHIPTKQIIPIKDLSIANFTPQNRFYLDFENFRGVQMIDGLEKAEQRNIAIGDEYQQHTLIMSAVSASGKEIAIVREQDAGGFETVNGGCYTYLGKHLFSFPIQRGYFPFICFDPHFQRLAVSSNETTISIYEMPSGRQIESFQSYQVGGIRALTFNRQSPMRLAYIDGLITWKIRFSNGHIIARQEDIKIESLAFSPEGDKLAILREDGSIRVYRYPELKHIESYEIGAS